MNIVQPSYTIYNDSDNDIPFNLNEGIKLLRKIEYMARISHGSEEAQTAISYDRFLRSVVLSKGDWSVVEHASLTVIVCVDRGVSHEWVRHRIASYTQSSTRFINYTKKIEPSFIMPEGMNELSRAIWTDAIEFSEAGYKRMIEAGCTPQIARSVFPNALMTKIAITCNLRNWRHFFLMRTSRESHPQIRQVTIPLLEVFKEMIPILYEDIEPGNTQAENLKKMR